jgi:hypothetical protein
VLTALLLGGVAALSLLLGLSRFAGASVRDNAQLLVRAPMPDAAPNYSDLPRGGALFEDRDSVTIVVPRSMRVSEFLSLYHLENNASARSALERQLGASAWDDVLEKDARVTLRLTRGRESGVAEAPR